MLTKAQYQLKRLSTVLVLGLLVTRSASAASPAQSVLDHYRQVPETFFLQGSKYKLTRAKGAWITHSSSTEAELSVTVDTQNGYISFVDEGTGGGSMTLEVVLFLKANKSPLLAIRQDVYDGAAFEGRVVFIERKQGQWRDVTGSVLPPPRLEDFLDAKCVAAMSSGTKEYLLKKGIGYKLPQWGTTIQASLWVSELMFPEGMNDKEALCLGKNLRELTWDKRVGRFTLAAKGG